MEMETNQIYIRYFLTIMKEKKEKCERCKKEFKPIISLDDHWVFESISGITDKWTCFECKAEVYHSNLE